MNQEKIGGLIFRLRKQQGLTQRELGESLHISDKTVSKWERGQGCPDVSLLPALSRALRVNLEQLLEGELETNESVGGNMKKARYFVCPSCGNLSVCTGNAAVTCCGTPLQALEAQAPTEEERLHIEQIEDEWFITTDHPMTKEHHISFLAFATGDKVRLVKQYPEWGMQVRFCKREHGRLLWYCTQHGLYGQNL